MNSFELNKVLGAVLGTCLAILALNIAADAIFSREKPAKPGYVIAVQTEGAPKEAAAPKVASIAVRLQKASVDKGKQIAKQCQACHTLAKGQPNRIGPNLYNIVENHRGEDRNGFAFSSAMKAKGGTWTYEELDKFLTNPRGYIPGTAMTFAGIKNPQQRADVIDYLHTLSDNPKPLPKVVAEAKPAAKEAAKPAEKSAAAAKEPTLADRLAKASVDKGKQIAKQCQVCHTLAKGGPNKIGPNLYNIVGNARGEDRGGFNFSAAMKKKGGKWTYEELNKFLTAPRQYIPGTLMTFAGIKDPQKRADVIAYLHTLSDNPEPLPKAAGKPAAAASNGAATNPAERAPAAPAKQ
jgi:cytochrome c